MTTLASQTPVVVGLAETPPVVAAKASSQRRALGWRDDRGGRLPAVDPSALATRLGATDVFLRLIAAAAEPLDARALKLRLVALGVDQASADLAWRRAQPSVRADARVRYEPASGTYSYGDADQAVSVSPGVIAPATPPVARRVATPAQSEPPGALQALAELIPGRLTERRAALVEVLRSALAERDDLESRLRGAYAGARADRQLRDRQARLDTVRVLADVVSDVEELAAAGADLTVAAERVRALAQAFGLVAIGRAGQAVAFDPTRHEPIGGHPGDGSVVTVIRPGYHWPAEGEELLIHRAQVAGVLAPDGRSRGGRPWPA